jgi:predicted nucleotide-binding protein (sugar kinase/HSP70/actin superfamily)
LKITFPHMGNTYISAKVLLDFIGIEYEIPPLCNKRTLEIGVKNSPECICLPFKTIIGNLMDGLDNGADVVFFGGGCGQCRLGYYGELLKEILKDMGYKFKYLEIDFGRMSFKDIIREIKTVAGGISTVRLFIGICFALRTVFLVDGLYKKASYCRCREQGIGKTDEIINKFKRNVLGIKGFFKTKRLIKNAHKQLNSLKLDKKARPKKIAVVGEIFIACEPFTNFDIEQKLGAMGVEVYNHLSISEWIREHFILNLIPFKVRIKAQDASREYLNTDDVGGHGIETVGNCVICGKKGFDGIIHIYPFSCMPEIVAQSTFNDAQNKYNIPIMSLVIDELTGEAGYITRLEAFVDMIESNKRTQPA